MIKREKRRDREAEALRYHTYFQASYPLPPIHNNYNPLCLKISASVLVVVPVLKYGTNFSLWPVSKLSTKSVLVLSIPIAPIRVVAGYWLLVDLPDHTRRHKCHTLRYKEKVVHLTSDHLLFIIRKSATSNRSVKKYSYTALYTDT